MNIDGIVFIVFLVATIIVGLYSSRGIKTIREYAIGRQDFDTTTIAATILATWISGSTFFNNLSETYNDGLYFMWTRISTSLELIAIGVIFAPRMKEFLGKISIADAMGQIYGKHVQIITAIAGFIGTAGCIAAQFKVSSLLFEYCFGLDGSVGIVISAIIVTVYAALGGIKSVTFTDVIQLITFGAVIPTIAFFILSNMDSLDSVFAMLKSNKKFDYNEVFDFTQSKSIYYFFLFLYWSIPIFNPPIFQRVAMSNSISQVRNAFVIAGIGYFVLSVIIFWIAILVLSTNPNLESKNILQYIIDNYSYTGLKGLTLAGIMAMVMSTADSFINATAVIFVHDFCKPLKIKFASSDLVASRVASFVLGGLGLILALKGGSSILKIIILANSFYMPVVTVPFMMTIFGFRSSTKSVLLSMAAGLGIVLLWMAFDIKAVDAVIPGMVVNLLTLMGSHYLLKQPGGWVKKAPSQLNGENLQSKRRTKPVSFIDFLKKNTPNREAIYVFTGLFSMVMTYANMHNTPAAAKLYYGEFIRFAIPVALTLATILLSYPLWLKRWKGQNLGAALLWNSLVFTLFVCNAFAFVVMSDFAPLQLTIFMVNVLIVASLVRWQLAVSMILVGMILTFNLFKIYAPEVVHLSFELQSYYILVLVSSVCIVFLKPKQDYIDATENRVEYYSEQLKCQQEEIDRLGATAQRILNNVNHELRLPISNVLNFSDLLNSSLMQSDDHTIKELAREVYQNSNRVSSMILNMLDLAMLDAQKVKLDKSLINFTELVCDRIEKCKKIYLEDKDIEFKLHLEPDVMALIDPNYMRQVIDNLVINSIKFSQHGCVEVKLYRDGNDVCFSIKDEGLGIPPEDLFDVFTPFKMGRNTESKANGRGVGLALCKAAIEAHCGNIQAASNGEVGAKLEFCIPLS